MKSCGFRKGSGREMGNYEFNWSGLIVTSTKLLDTKYTFYGFNDDLIETIK